MHALNNLLGGTPYIEEEELSLACDTVLEESRYPDDQHGHYSIELRSNHEDASGWYSSEVLAMALSRTFQYELVVHPLQDNPGELFAEQMIGALCHQDGPPKHWVALRVVAGQVWLLDSKKTPRALTRKQYEVIVAKHRKCFPVRRL